MTFSRARRAGRAVRPGVEAVEGRVLCAAGPVIVPGTANPYLVDPANRTGPAQAIDGTTPPSIAVTAGGILTFTVSGSTSYGGGVSTTFPDGGTLAQAAYGARGAVSTWNLPFNSLAGIFQGATPGAAPGPYTGSRSATDISPQIGQVFPIGDGLTGSNSGTRQIVHVPAGATTLYLANIDAYEWGNDRGQFSVTVAQTPLAWGQRVSSQFQGKVVDLAKQLGTNPSWLMAGMAFQTGETFSPATVNNRTKARGLIQFLPKTASSLRTTVKALSRMTAEQQLDYVAKYLAPYSGRLNSVDDVSMAMLFPKAIGQPDTYVVFDKRKSRRSYLQNRGLDSNGDGKITKTEAASRVKSELQTGYAPQNVSYY